jgi:hypothetical protein
MEKCSFKTLSHYDTPISMELKKTAKTSKTIEVL